MFWKKDPFSKILSEKEIEQLLEKTDRMLIIEKFVGDSISEGRIDFPVTLRVYYFRVNFRWQRKKE